LKTSLTIQIDTPGRTKLQELGQKVAIVKSFLDAPKYPVVCIVFQPFGPNNVVKFISDYYVYASGLQFSPGKTVVMNESQLVSGGSTYTFTGITFDQGKTGLPPNTYGVSNQRTDKENLTIGLAQEVINEVDGDGKKHIFPINVAVVPFNETIYFKPLEEVQVFVASGMNNSEVIQSFYLQPSRSPVGVGSEYQNIVGKYLAVDFSKDPSQTIYYDNVNNIFALGPLPK